MTTLDLTAEAATEIVPLGPLPELLAGERVLLESTWRGRMVNEHVSAQVYAGLIPQAMQAGLQPALIAELAQMITEELRHARQCAAVLRALGGVPKAPMPALQVMPVHADCSPRASFFRNVMSVSCLSETVAVALIDAERQDQDGGPTSAVLGKILGDEVGHARFGWKLLESQLTDELRPALDVYLPHALHHLWAFELANLSPVDAPSERAVAAGACNGAQAREILHDTITQVIVPGLEKQGLAAQAAWKKVLFS